MECCSWTRALKTHFATTKAAPRDVAFLPHNWSGSKVLQQQFVGRVAFDLSSLELVWWLVPSKGLQSINRTLLLFSLSPPPPPFTSPAPCHVLLCHYYSVRALTKEAICCIPLHITCQFFRPHETAAIALQLFVLQGQGLADG